MTAWTRASHRAGLAAQPGRQVEGRAAIPAFDRDGLTGVEPDPTPRGSSPEPHLELERRPERATGQDEHRQCPSRRSRQEPVAGTTTSRTMVANRVAELGRGVGTLLVRVDRVAVHVGDEERLELGLGGRFASVDPGSGGGVMVRDGAAVRPVVRGPPRRAAARPPCPPLDRCDGESVRMRASPPVSARPSADRRALTGPVTSGRRRSASRGSARGGRRRSRGPAPAACRAGR